MDIRRRVFSASFLLCSTAAVSACSSSGSVTPAGPAPVPSISSGPAKTASVTIRVTIPARTPTRRSRPSYVSAQTNSVSLTISNGGAAVGSPTVLDCTSGQTCSTTASAPVGSDTFALTAYASSGAQGSKLGIGSTTQTIDVAQVNTVAVTLNGVVNSVAVVVTSPTSLPAGTKTTETVSVNALDASGETIVAPGGYVDASGNSVTISVSRTDYGNGKGATAPSPSPAPTIAAPGQTIDYAYNGSDIDETVFATTTSSAILGSQGSAAVTYVPTLIARYADTSASDTNFITTGPDGNLWFTDFASGQIGSIVPGTGAITHYSIPSSTANGGAEPEAIVAGPNDTMYFAEFNSSAIGSISTSTAATLGSSTVITETNLTTTNANPRGIAYDTVCDPNIWFTEFNGNKIGTLSLTTMTVTEYSTGLTAAANPDQIACGPDGNFWFTEYAANKIGRITNAGTITEFPLPTPSGPHGPIGIVAGADGSMWFAESTGNMIGSIATSKTVPATTPGTIVEYPIPTPPANPSGNTMAPSIITSAPDGDLFFSEFNSETSTTNAMIGRFTTSAAVAPESVADSFTQYPLVQSSNMPFGISVGPDGHIWFDEMGSGRIGYIVY